MNSCNSSTYSVFFHLTYLLKSKCNQYNHLIETLLTLFFYPNKI
nr:MAG TPA: hypothetical protein [Caudoviricetes sp.]